MIIGMYHITLLIVIGIYAIASLGLNITMGYAGQVNLGQAAFFGIGAFTSAILSVGFGFPFWLTLPISGLTSMITGIALGACSVRLRHDFLAMTTIGINFLAVSIFLYYPLFGGSFGITGIPHPYLFGYECTGPSFLLIVLAVLAACIVTNKWIEGSWMGMAFEVLREDEEAAQTIGIDVRKFKILAFAIGTAYAGLAGSLYAHFKIHVAYSDFTFPRSIEILCMTALGGLGTIPGSLLGSSLIILLPEIFRPLLEYRMILYAIMLIILLRFQPQGILGKGSFITQKLFPFLVFKFRVKEAK